MAFPKLTENTESEEATFRPWINTGGPLDIITGTFMPSTYGGHLLSGGLGLTTAIVAEANRFKSTLLNSSAVNALARFPGSEFHLNDTEYSTLNINRLSSMSDLYLGKGEEEKRAKHLEELKNSIHMYDPTTNHAESLDAWFDFMKEIRDRKIKLHKEYTVETEFLDPMTGKPHRMLLPTFMSIDSLSEAMVRQMNVKNEEFDANSEMKEQRTIHMEEGWQKARLLRQMSSICAKAGIYLLLTGHMGKKMAIGNTPNKKDMQYMGQDESVKGMSSKFYFLMFSMLKIGNTEPVVDKADRRLPEYPSEAGIAANELQRLLAVLVRCKNSASGDQVRWISSQTQGLLTGLSYYDTLRENKYYGLGAPNKVRNPLLGDMNLGRTKIFDLANEYTVRRALELTYQYFVIKTSWNPTTLPVDFSMDIEEFAERLMTSNSIMIEDILNTRGWWTYKQETKPEREHLSLPDAMNLLNGNYEPKWLNLGGIPEDKKK